MKESLKAITILLRATHSVEDVLKKDILSYDFNTTEFGTLEFLYHKGKQPIQNICNRLLMANSSMTYVIDKLEKKQLVNRVVDPKNRRSTYIALTEDGINLIQSIFPQHEARINEIFSILSNDELENLTYLLKKVGIHSQELLKNEKEE
jgi:MarR family transcriptional regulator, 2-MHQ and catechol-resistance regulon repressor